MTVSEEKTCLVTDLDNLTQESLDMLYDAGKLTPQNKAAHLSHERHMAGFALLLSDSDDEEDIESEA